MTAVDGKTYRVVVTREGEDWLAEVPDAPPAHTFARNLESLDRYVREAIVLAEDLPDDATGGLVLEWEFRTGHEVLDRELAVLRRARAHLEVERAQVEADTARFAHELAAAHFSVRDVSALLGVSRARAQQLISA